MSEQEEEFDTLENEIDRESHKYKPSTIRSIKNKEKVDKSRHYVDKAAFYADLVQRTADIKEAEAKGLEKPQISNFVGKCIMDIATNMSRKYNFAGYHYRDEMVGAAVEHCIHHIDSFDITKSNNPFSYFTQACYFVMIAKIKDEKKQLYVKCRSTLDHAAFGNLAEITEESGEIAEHIHDNFLFKTDFVESFVSDYEHKIAEAKKAKVVDTPKSPLDELLDDEDEDA